VLLFSIETCGKKNLTKWKFSLARAYFLEYFMVLEQKIVSI